VLEPSGLYYPNRFARAFFAGAEAVMGKPGLRSLLGLADLQMYFEQLPPDDAARQFDFAHLTAISIAMEDMYGVRGGRSLALRIGRTSFNQGFQSFGAMAGLASPAFRQLPLIQRAQLALQALALVFTNFSDQASTLQEEGEAYLFSAEITPFAWGRRSEKPVCHALVGLLQEMLHWSTEGYEYYVHETACRASGDDACVFRINKKPIGQG
jgi:hypothetical protein